MSLQVLPVPASLATPVTKPVTNPPPPTPRAVRPVNTLSRSRAAKAVRATLHGTVAPVASSRSRNVLPERPGSALERSGDGPFTQPARNPSDGTPSAPEVRIGKALVRRATKWLPGNSQRLQNDPTCVDSRRAEPTEQRRPERSRSISDVRASPGPSSVKPGAVRAEGVRVLQLCGTPCLDGRVESN